jgi:signal transduction histidine kinase
VAVALLALTGAAAWSTGRAVDDRSDQLLRERAIAVSGAVDRRTDFYVEKLYGLRAVFAATRRPVTHRGFDDYLRGQDLLRRFPAIGVVGMVEDVREDEREGFVRRVREDIAASGLAYYPPLVIRPPGRRERYGVVAYTHPIAGSRAVFGTDVYQRPGRRAAFMRARDRAGLAAPPALPLPQDGPRGPLTLTTILPLYAGLDQSPDRGERIARFEGAVFHSLRLPRLFGGIADRRRGEDLEIVDAGRTIFDSTPRSRARETEHVVDLPLQTAGRPWRVVFGSDAQLVSSGERAVPWLIAAFGILVSLLAAAVVQALSSSRRRAEALAEGMTVDLKRSNQELERFAFVASHDLQQPLRTISGFLQLLDRQAGDTVDERGREYIHHALRGAQQMSSLIDDLLAYSRVARDDRPLNPVSLERAWDTAVGQLGAELETTGAAVSRGSLPTVPGDEGQLTQVFANLIANAVKYRGEEPPRVRADARKANGVWEIAVQDNGIGIDPQDHARIFEMFRRLHTEDQVEGSGVGLALVKRIVERSGGDIAVESAPGEGSRFVLRMPDASVLGRTG